VENLVKGVKRARLAQVTVKKAKINSESFPVDPSQFVILNIEGKKN
jgi:hypothetical protein